MVLPDKHRTIASTGVRELAGFEMDNLSRVPGDACRSAIRDLYWNFHMNRRNLVIALLGIVVAFVVAFTWRPVLIAYHRLALEQTNSEFLAASTAEALAGVGSSAESASGLLAAKQRKHCTMLVRLGYFFHDTYEMDRVPVSGESHSTLVGLWPHASPNYIYSTMSTDFVFDVYDLPERRDQWDLFVRQYNTPDLVERFSTPQQAEL